MNASRTISDWALDTNRRPRESADERARCGEDYPEQEVSSPLVLSGGDLPELPEPREEPLDQIARRMHRMVERPWHRTVARRGGDGGNSDYSEIVDNGVGAADLRRDHLHNGFDAYKQHLGSGAIGSSTGRQDQGPRHLFPSTTA